MAHFRMIESSGRFSLEYRESSTCDCSLLKKIGKVVLGILMGAVIGTLIASKVITLPCAIILLLAGASPALIQMLAIRVAIAGAAIGATALGIAVCQEEGRF